MLACTRFALVFTEVGIAWPNQPPCCTCNDVHLRLVLSFVTTAWQRSSLWESSTRTPVVLELDGWKISASCEEHTHVIPPVLQPLTPKSRNSTRKLARILLFGLGLHPTALSAMLCMPCVGDRSSSNCRVDRGSHQGRGSYHNKTWAVALQVPTLFPIIPSIILALFLSPFPSPGVTQMRGH